MRIIFKFLLSLIFLVNIFETAIAQQSPDAGLLLRQLEKNNPGILIPKPKLPEASKSEQTPYQNVDPTKTFTITKFIFEGNTIVSTYELNEIFNPIKNKNININDLKLAIDRVAILYDKKGYVGFAKIASQEITNQNIKILIIEGKFGGVKLDPKNEKDLKVDSEIIKKIIENSNTVDQPINTKKLDESILISNRLSGVTVNQTLIPGDKEGQTISNISITNLPEFQFLISADDSGSKSTGQKQSTANAAWLSPLKIGDRLDGIYNYSEGSNFINLAYTVPIGNFGTNIGVKGNALNYSVINGANKSLGLTGNATSLATNLSQPIILSRSMSLIGTTSFERKDFSNSQAFGGSGLQSKYFTETFNIGSDFYMPIDYLLGGVVSSSLILSSSYNNYNDSPSQFKQNKIATGVDGRSEKLSLNASYNQIVLEGIESLVKLSGQVANRNLDSSQQIYLGGPNGVRAYPVNEGAGTEGYILNFETAKVIYPEVKVKIFYDYANAKKYYSTTGVTDLTTPNNFTLQGYGIGIDANYAGAILNFSISDRIGNNPLRTASGSDTNGTPARLQIWTKVYYNY